MGTAARADLNQKVARYATLALAPSTHAAYNQGELRYRNFCRLCQWNPLPATDFMLASFAAHIASSVRPTTVANYMAAVRNLHLECGMQDPTKEAMLLPRVLRGIKRAHGLTPVCTRLPLTGSLIPKIVDQVLLDTTISNPDRKMIQAAILLAFHGFLRCAELVINEPCDFDPRVQATSSAITISNGQGKPILQFRVKRSKTDPFAKGMVLHIGGATTPYCPVVAMVEYLAVMRPASDKPLFCFASGVPLTRATFTSKVRTLLLRAGIRNASEYAGYLFRIGAATTAPAAGVPEWQIRAMGRWQSDCVLRYIRSSPAQLATVASSLCNAPI